MQDHEPQSYKWKEHIRMRPGMYIGDRRSKGFRQMLEYLFEELMTNAQPDPVFEIEFLPANKYSIRASGINTERILSQLQQFYQDNDKLTNLALGVLIALCDGITIEVHNTPTVVVFFGQNGGYQIAASISAETENMILINCPLDKEIFPDLELVYDHINSFLKQFAFLNPSLKIISLDNTGEEFQRNVFHFPTGVLKQLDLFISLQPYGKPLMRLNIESQIRGYAYRIGICYSDTWVDKSVIHTYANNVETYLGGSLDDGIIDGIILSMKALAGERNKDIHINKKLAKAQLVIVASLRGENLNFEGSTKSKLGMPRVRQDTRKLIAQHFTDYFKTNPKAGDDLLDKFRRMD